MIPPGKDSGKDSPAQDPLDQDPLDQDEGVTKMQFVRDFCSSILVCAQILWEVSCVRGIVSVKSCLGILEGRSCPGNIDQGI